jgi:hypothetical protein
MESYGVGLACKRREIPFGMVKGVSDYAGEDKKEGSPKADSYRLAALASAAAFAFQVLTDKKFRSQLPRLADRRGWGQSACVWSQDQAPGICAHRDFHTRMVARLSDSETFSRYRPCVDAPKFLGLNKNEILGSRLVEGVKSVDYSTYLTNALNRHGARLILLYPYSVKDLLSFFWSIGDENLRKKVFKMEALLSDTSTNATDRIGELTRNAIGLGIEAHYSHRHFIETNKICWEMIKNGKGISAIANKICRIMCLYHKDLFGISTNPAFLMYIAMCGVYVPTLLATSKVLEDFDPDEATYVLLDESPPRQRKGERHRPARDESQALTMCLKYSARSKLLTVLGWCESRPMECGAGNILSLAHDVQVWLDAFRKNGQNLPSSNRYQLFPVGQLLQIHDQELKKSNKTLWTYRDQENEKARSLVQEYFNNITALEPSLTELDSGDGGRRALGYDSDLTGGSSANA